MNDLVKSVGQNWKLFAKYKGKISVDINEGIYLGVAYHKYLGKTTIVISVPLL